MRTETELAYLVAMIVATAEAIGCELKPMTAAIMAKDLDRFSTPEIEDALTDCRCTLRHKLTIADVRDRVLARDGRPGVEEAWALIPKDEESSVVWCDEMSSAWGVVAGLYADGDRIGARMAFRDTYSRMVAEAREAGRPVRWWASLGADPAGRERALQMAVSAKRLTEAVASKLLPSPVDPGPIGDALFGGAAPLLLASGSTADKDVCRQRIADLRAMLGSRRAAP